jgi:hypothetical protein
MSVIDVALLTVPATVVWRSSLTFRIHRTREPRALQA